MAAEAANSAGCSSRTVEGSTDRASKRHLVVLVNGLFGNSGNWDVVIEKLQLHADDGGRMVLYASQVNQYKQTFEGIDRCGERLANEIKQVVADHPHLERISVIGHSMGGLIARYAIGQLYDSRSGRVAGLQPSHYVSMATPHLGCDVAGVAQVPLIDWSQYLPLKTGPALQGLLRQWAAPVTALALGRAGQQFFFRDGASGTPPLLYRMARDVPGEAMYHSALAAFRTRTCYANSSGDHLVGWSNASLRQPHQLPLLKASGCGVVREDPLETAFSNRDASSGDTDATGRQACGAAAPSGRPAQRESGGGATAGGGGGAAVAARQASWVGAAAVQPNPASAMLQLSRSSSTRSGGSRSTIEALPAVAGAGNAPLAEYDLTLADGALAAAGDRAASLNRADTADTDSVEDAEKLMDEAPYMGDILAMLADLPWRRVDVCFQELGIRRLLAHNHIQVTRKWLNMDGEAVAEHLAHSFAAMERVVQDEERVAGGPHG